MVCFGVRFRSVATWPNWRSRSTMRTRPGRPRRLGDRDVDRDGRRPAAALRAVGDHGPPDLVDHPAVEGGHRRRGRASAGTGGGAPRPGPRARARRTAWPRRRRRRPRGIGSAPRRRPTGRCTGRGSRPASGVARIVRQTSAGSSAGSITSMMTRLWSPARRIASSASVTVSTANPTPVRACADDVAARRRRARGGGSDWKARGLRGAAMTNGRQDTTARRRDPARSDPGRRGRGRPAGTMLDCGPGSFRLRIGPATPSRRSRPAVSAGRYPRGRSRCPRAPLRTDAGPPTGRRRRSVPGHHRPDHPPDHRRRRPDRQGRPVGPPPSRLPDRPLPRGLVPHRDLRGPGRGRSSSSSAACSSPRSCSATSSPGSSDRSRPPAAATTPQPRTSSTRVTCRRSRTRRTRSSASGSTSPRARPLRPRSTERRPTQIRRHGPCR